MPVHQLPSGDVVRVPNAILFDRQLSLGARVLYIILLSYDWQPGQPLPHLDTLREAMQCDTEALSAFLDELKVHGVLEG
jgi:hypothetical protein